MEKYKKILIIAGFGIGFILLQLLSFKIALIQINKPESGDNYKTLETVLDDVVITTTNTGDTKNYVDIIYPNSFSEFKFSKDRSTNKYSTYNLYSEEDKYSALASFTVGLAYNYYDELITDSDKTIDQEKKNLLEKYDITNNFDVIDYLVKHYNDKVNLLSSSDEIKLRSIMNGYANNGIVEGNLRYIKGDLEGFMFTSENENVIQVNLKHDDKVYYFSFTNHKDSEYFNLDKVLEFLSHVSFK